MFTTKLKTIKDGLNMMGWGSDWKSKKILLFADLLTHLGHERKKLRSKIFRQIEKVAVKDEVSVNIKIHSKDTFSIKFRLHDYCDFMGLGECLGDVYDFPKTTIHYFVDAGANIGFFSVSMAKRSNVKEAIVIEPNPSNLSLLRYNLSSFSHYIILPIAVSATGGEMFFELAQTNTGHLRGSIGHPSTEETVMVKVQQLSKLIPSHWKMENTLLKIDIEGAEYEVLPELFDNKIFPAIIVGEIHDYLQSNGAALVQLMESNDYSVKVSGYGNSGNVCRQIVAIRKQRD